MLWVRNWGRAELTLIVSTPQLEGLRGLGVTQQMRGQNHLEACSLAVDARCGLGPPQGLWTRAPPQASWCELGSSYQVSSQGSWDSYIATQGFKNEQGRSYITFPDPAWNVALYYFRHQIRGEGT